jgi:DNA sulfur modification protein DndE
MKSGKDEEGRKRGIPTENVIVYNCKVYNGHGGFVVGSEMSGGVRNIMVKHCSFIGTDNGLRFKSTRGRGGIVENIYISDITMVNIVRDAILYDLYYMTRENSSSIPLADQTTPQFRNIYMKNIVCNGADRAILLQGLPEMTLKNIYLENATIKSRTGVFCTDAEQIQMKNVIIHSKEQPIVSIKDATDILMDNFSYNDAAVVIDVTGNKTNKIRCINTSIKPERIKSGPEVKAGALQMN